MSATSPNSDAKTQSALLCSPPLPYPPCIFTTLAERQLYSRLKNIYERHFHTWDKEAIDAWPELVEKASLRPTTSKKVTSHKIAKALTEDNITWAHVVILRVIFKEALFSSPKTIKIIRKKYPSANFNTFAYNDMYKIDRTAEMHGLAERMPAQVNDANDERDAPLSGSPRKGNEIKIEVTVESEKSKEKLPDRKSLRRKKEEEVVMIKQQAREDSLTANFLSTPKYFGERPTASTKRKHNTSAADDDEEQVAKPASSDGVTRQSKSRGQISKEVFKQLPKESGSSSTAKRFKKEESTTLKATSPAKKGTSPGIQVENPLEEIRKTLAEHDKALKSLEKLGSSINQLTKATEKRVKDIERDLQRQAERGAKMPQEDVKQSIEIGYD